MIRYRVVLEHETGFEVLADGFGSYASADRYADKHDDEYGEGQRLVVESYNARYQYA